MSTLETLKKYCTNNYCNGCQFQVVKEAIVRCDFNSEVALNTLLNNPVGHRGSGKKSGNQVKISETVDDEGKVREATGQYY